MKTETPEPAREEEQTNEYHLVGASFELQGGTRRLHLIPLGGLTIRTEWACRPLDSPGPKKHRSLVALQL